MAFELRELSGSIFKNRKKEQSSHPDMTGEAKINGKIYWVSAWKKTDKNQNDWFSFSFKEKDFTPAKEATREQQKAAFDENQDVPF